MRVVPIYTDRYHPADYQRRDICVIVDTFIYAHMHTYIYYIDMYSYTNMNTYLLYVCTDQHILRTSRPTKYKHMDIHVHVGLHVHAHTHTYTLIM